MWLPGSDLPDAVLPDDVPGKVPGLGMEGLGAEDVGGVGAEVQEVMVHGPEVVTCRR